MGQKVSTNEKLDSPAPNKDNILKQKKVPNHQEDKTFKNSVFNLRNGRNGIG